MTFPLIATERCPNCGCEFIVGTFASCNTFGVTFYTDGFVDGPMYEEDSALLVYPECDTLFWWEDTPPLESTTDTEYFPESDQRSLPVAGKIQGHHYEDAICKSLWKNNSQEKCIRIKSWWLFNNNYRNNAAQEFNLPPEQKANLQRLLHLLDTNDPNDLLMKAEVFRTLGRFNECLKELSQPVGSGYSRAVYVIEKLAKSRKRQVVKLSERPTNYCYGVPLCI